MADDVRVFCKEDPSLTLQQIKEVLSEEGFDSHFGLEEDDETEDPSWTETTLIYSDEEEPIHLECWRDDESDEFSDYRDELLEDLENSKQDEKDRVIKHLKESTFVVVVTLMSDENDEAIQIQNSLLVFLANSHDGLAYVDEEGYYAAEELILEMR